MSDAPKTPPALPGIPPAADALFRRLLDEDAREGAALGDEVSRYLERVRQAAARDEEIDLGLAEALAARSHALLDRARGEASPARRRLVQAAVRYFVTDEDAEGDLVSVLGFDDDVRVMNAVCRYLGHADLAIDLD